MYAACNVNVASASANGGVKPGVHVAPSAGGGLPCTHQLAGDVHVPIGSELPMLQEDPEVIL